MSDLASRRAEAVGNLIAMGKSLLAPLAIPVRDYIGELEDLIAELVMYTDDEAMVADLPEIKNVFDAAAAVSERAAAEIKIVRDNLKGETNAEEN